MKNTKNKIWYPNIKQIISYNKLMIEKFKATKAEKHEILNREHISAALKQTKEFPGSIEDKAAILVRVLSYHPFSAGNRRTAYYAMNKFLWKNRMYLIAKDKPSGKIFMYKIRKGELSHDEIKDEISIHDVNNNTNNE